MIAASFRATAWLLVLFVLSCIGFVQAAPWSVSLPAAQFTRSELPRPGDADSIRRGATLSGGDREWGIFGWVEFDFVVPHEGWYELLARPGAGDAEFLIDVESGKAAAYFHGAGGRIGDAEKIGNVWLARGAHRLRAQRHHWTGLPRISAFELRDGEGAPEKSLRAFLPDDHRIFRVGECPQLNLQVGGARKAVPLQVFVEEAGGKPVSRTPVAVPGPGPSVTRSVALPCTREGRFVVSFGGPDGRYSWPEARPIDYEVVDTRPVTRDVEAGPVLIKEIDCVKQAPDYEGGGPTRVTRTAYDAYRESADRGFTRWQRLPDAARKLVTEPGWFAYRIGPLEPQRRHVIEVDYPDDALRTFAIALRESAPLSYALAGGVDSGGAVPLSRRMQTRRLVFWPRTTDPRIVLLNVHDDRRAAAARIRIYRSDGTPARPGHEGGRAFMNWYEEGENFFSLYGAPDDWNDAPRTAVRRWAQSLAESGGSVLAPTVGVYDFGLYPSQFMNLFSRPGRDLLTQMLLQAEKHGLRVLPELHPRADELDLPFLSVPDPKPNLLVSKDGRTSYYANDGRTRNYPPLHNPLHPQTRSWYLGVIGELAQRSHDSSAFLGVSLRLMPWANPSLNNFHSIDWGYDDLTVGLFARETGLAVPMGAADDAGRFALRYRWIMANARERWIDWRCAKIASLYAEIRDRLRSVRPDLTLFTSVFPWQDRDDTATAWREAGVDLRRIAALEGVTVVDADQGFGRREPDADFERRQRARLLDPANLNLPQAQARAYLTGAYYLEATDAVVRPEALGFPANTKRTWMSAVATPAGRNILEPYAIQLAESDANLLGVGGNGYTLGNLELREFLAEYRALPIDNFVTQSSSGSLVVVRQLARPGSLLIYAVNPNRDTVVAQIGISGASRIERLRDGSALDQKAGIITLTLEPFGMISIQAVGNAWIDSVHSQPFSR